jgi:hypothetical protein
VAAQWDDEGDVIEIEIETEDEVYPVILYGAGAELVDYVGEVVRVRGILFANDDGKQILRVDSFRMRDDEEAQPDT